jgi:hypothetical protein
MASYADYSKTISETVGALRITQVLQLIHETLTRLENSNLLYYLPKSVTLFCMTKITHKLAAIKCTNIIKSLRQRHNKDIQLGLFP